MITLVYEIRVDPASEPKGADDAASASWYDVNKLVSEKPAFAFDHFDIIREYLEKFHTGRFEF